MRSKPKDFELYSLDPASTGIMGVAHWTIINRRARLMGAYDGSVDDCIGFIIGHRALGGDLVIASERTPPAFGGAKDADGKAVGYGTNGKEAKIVAVGRVLGEVIAQCSDRRVDWIPVPTWRSIVFGSSRAYKGDAWKGAASQVVRDVFGLRLGHDAAEAVGVGVAWVVKNPEKVDDFYCPTAYSKDFLANALSRRESR